MFVSYLDSTCVVLVGRETPAGVRRMEPPGSIFPDRGGSGPRFLQNIVANKQAIDLNLLCVALT